MLEVIRDENLCERALLLGGQLTETLQGAGCSALAEVRGRGSMIAAEFTNSEGQPSADIAKAIQQEALDEGLLLLRQRYSFPLPSHHSGCAVPHGTESAEPYPGQVLGFAG